MSALLWALAVTVVHACAFIALIAACWALLCLLGFALYALLGLARITWEDWVRPRWYKGKGL